MTKHNEPNEIASFYTLISQFEMTSLPLICVDLFERLVIPDVDGHNSCAVIA